MEAAPKGEPLRLPGRSKDHKWLVHSGSQHSNGNEDDKRLVLNCRHSFWCKDDERLVPLAVGTDSSGCHRREREDTLPRVEQGSQMASAHQFQQSFGSEDHKRLVRTGCRHSFWSEDDERLVPPPLPFRHSLRRFAPPRRRSPSPPPGGCKDPKWLVHTGCQHSNGSKDDKRLVPTFCWHSF